MRDLQRAEQHYAQVKEDVHVKQLQIEDHKKKYQEMQLRLVDLIMIILHVPVSTARWHSRLDETI